MTYIVNGTIKDEMAGAINTAPFLSISTFNRGESIMSASNITEFCAKDGCPLKAHSRGWCKPHYDAWYRHGDPNLYKGDRSSLSLWEKVQEIGWTASANGCMEYNGSRANGGYGQFRDNSTNKEVRVHRLVYQTLIGSLEGTEVVMHKCDNPPCSNPNHLAKGSHADNMRDMTEKCRNRHANWTHCPNGHPYPSERPKNISKNRCRVCANDRSKRYYVRKKETI